MDAGSSSESQYMLTRGPSEQALGYSSETTEVLQSCPENGMRIEADSLFMTQPGCPVASCVRVQPVRHKPQERQVWGCVPGIPELARLRQDDIAWKPRPAELRGDTLFGNQNQKKKNKTPVVWGQHRCSPHFPNGESEASLGRLRHRLKKRVFSSGPWLDSQAVAWLGGRAPQDMRLSVIDRLTEFLRPHFKVAWKANHAFS